MRISADERDSGFRTYQAWGGIFSGAKVLLDGVELKRCVTADEDLGEVLVTLEGEGGTTLFAATGKAWHREWRYGKVEIVMPRRAAA